jgi:hypothetical protein
MTTKTINLRNVPEGLVIRAKLCATLRGLTLKDFILRAVQQVLDQEGAELASVGMFISTGVRKTNKRARRKGGGRTKLR